ncbi:outer membrane protein transport protein [soil metagenome]
MRKLFLALLLCPATFLIAQLPEDALRYGYPLTGGTARNQAIGGAGGSLGGDLTAANINPAGIGLYKNKEIVLSPGYNFISNKFNYRGTDNKGSDNAFNYGTSGFVFGSTARNDPSKSMAFSVSINQLANYNNHIEYKGLNKISSWSEQYVEQLANDRASVSQAEQNYIFGSSLAYWTYLVDTLSDAQGNVTGYRSQVPVPGSESGVGGVNQYNIVDTKGGAHEISVAFANNIRDKLHLGLSLNIPVYAYTKDQTYREEDASQDALNGFSFFEYKEHYTTNGLGVNAKLGIIVRPIERLRLGFAVHTPTFASLTDKISSSIVANTENYTTKPQPISQKSEDLKENPNVGTYEYQVQTPFRLVASGSWVLSEVSNVKKQKGFVTADLEFVNYGGTRYTALSTGSTDDVDYYDNLNSIIKDRYKGALNVRLGGEMKFNTIMARAGFAYMGSPYKDKQLAGKRILLSGGLGYRNKGYFVDLTYVHAFVKQSDVPYYLNDKPSPIADGKNSRGNVVLTFGIKI